MAKHDKRPCIVCGRPIGKRTSTLHFRAPVAYAPPEPRSWGGFSDAIEAKPDGFREGERLYLSARPRNRAEAQRFVNGEIISSKRDGEFLSSVNYWDGESYTDPFFCTNECATRQGYASAQYGDRYRWKNG